MQLDAYATPEAEALIPAGAERISRAFRPRREQLTSLTAAASFLAAAVLLASLAPWHRDLSVSRVVLTVVVWIGVERVRFPVAGGWARPTMLAFVPMLFLLPTPIVPLVAAIPIAGRRLPDIARGRANWSLLVTSVCDAWFTIAPATVIVLAGAERFGWSHWPVYLVALLAQFALDAATGIGWAWAAEGIRPDVQLPLIGWVYVLDAALAPVALLVTASAVHMPALLLLALPLLGVLELFARERQQRLDNTLELSSAYRGTALLLGDVVEADDTYTGLHSRDVVALSLGVADALKLDPGRRRNVEFGALLHDVGKIRVPKEIINKPGALSETEWQVMRRHTIEGEAMLSRVGGRLAEVGRIVRSSHERYDGTGYPDGLRGEDIPLESRIVSTCDAFSAMTTDRSYRQARSESEAVAELRRCSGTHFDPVVVAALEGVLERSKLQRERTRASVSGSAPGNILGPGSSGETAGASAREAGTTIVGATPQL